MKRVGREGEMTAGGVDVFVLTDGRSFVRREAQMRGAAFVCFLYVHLKRMGEERVIQRNICISNQDQSTGDLRQGVHTLIHVKHGKERKASRKRRQGGT